MAARLPADLLKRSAEEGARLVALTYLEEIGRAERRLADPRDVEALHDFRVGLRRLRSCIRAYRGSLKGSVSKKMRRRLRDLTLATNAGRDAEVQLGWLRQHAGQLGAGETEGLAWLIGRLEGRQHEVVNPITSSVARRTVKVAARLRPRLEIVQLVVRTGPRQARCSFAQVTGELICSHVGQVGKKLKAVSSAEQIMEVHEARIAAKRLRYLLEPLSRRLRRAASLVGRLKQLQDVLGDLHDLQVLGNEIVSSLVTLEAANPPSGALPGLLALQRLAHEQSQTTFAGFQAQWADARAARFLTRADEVGRTLQQADENYAVSPASQPAVNNGTARRHPRSPAASIG